MDTELPISPGLNVLGTEATAQLLAAQESEPTPDLELENDNLGSYIDSQFRSFADFRVENGVEQTMLNSLRAINSDYTPEQLSSIEAAGGSSIFMGITGVKHRAAIAWLMDIFTNEEDKVWGLKPSPIPDLPPEALQAIMVKEQEAIQQLLSQGQQPTPAQVLQLRQKLQEDMATQVQDEANRRAKAMERKIHDLLMEGGFNECFEEFVQNLSALKAGIIKGPVTRMRLRKRWMSTQTGQQVLISVREPQLTFESVSPFDAYPSPVASGFEADFIERQRYSRQALAELSGLPGYNTLEIQAVLDEFDGLSGDSWLEALDPDRAEMEDKDEAPDAGNKFAYVEGLECWLAIPGSNLVEFGFDPPPGEVSLDPVKAYSICAIKIGTHVIYREYNPDPLGRKPYYHCGWCPKPGSFWYRGIPELMSECQTLANASMRSLVNNAAFASGPMMAINDVGRLPQGEDITAISPHRIFQFTNRTNSSAPPIQFFQPSMNAGELLSIYDRAVQIADDWTGIPAYAFGNDQVAGAGRALANYETVMTPTGPVPMGDIRVGDKVVNTYGSVSEVMGVFPQGMSDIFRVRFSNGETVDCDMQHRWSVSDHPERGFVTLTLRELLDRGLYRKTIVGERNPSGQRARWCLPYLEAVEFSEQEVRIDPYTMGVLIGNGDSRCRVCGMDDEVFARIPYPLGKIDIKPGNKAYSRTVEGVKADYHSYGMTCGALDKFIPSEYLFNSKAVRLELLRGLMDTDGCCAKTGDHIFFSTSSKRLADDFIFLAKSLGATSLSLRQYEEGVGTVRGRSFRRAVNYRITFSLEGQDIFHLARKQILVRNRPRVRVFITGMEYIGPELATCITVNSRDSLFVCGRFIPTHNTASGLSMLMSNAAKGIKRVILTVDKKIFKPLIERVYDQVMQNDPDQSIKGDVVVETTGAVSIMVKEQMSERRMQMLAATNNPTDLTLMGMPGRAELLRESLKSVEIPGKRLVLDDAEIERQVMQQQEQQAQMAQAQIQLEQAKLQAQVQKDQADTQLKGAELQLKQQELEMVKSPMAQDRLTQTQIKAQHGAAKVEQDQARVDNETLKTFSDMQKAKNEPANSGAA